jgi:hypothetical protein
LQHNPGWERLTRIAKLLFKILENSSGDLTGEARAAKALSQVLKVLTKTPGTKIHFSPRKEKLGESHEIFLGFYVHAHCSAFISMWYCKYVALIVCVLPHKLPRSEESVTKAFAPSSDTFDKK